MKLIITEEEKNRILNLYNINRDPIINEAWDISTVYHTVGDVLSTASDFIIPGSGAVIDTINAISYIIEAQYKPQQKGTYYLLGAISFAFVLIPGPLQMSSPVLKEFVKSGKVINEELLKNGLAIILSSIDNIIINIPEKITTALQSPMAQNILGKFGNKINIYVEDFKKNVKPLLANLNKTAINKQNI